MLTGGQTPGTAQLAPAASIPLNSPVAASTAVIWSRAAGHSLIGILDSMTARRLASGCVLTRSAIAPILALATAGSLVNAIARAYLSTTIRLIFALISSVGGASCAW